METCKAWGSGVFWRNLTRTFFWMLAVVLAACSDGGGDAPAAPVAPTITAQPADTQVIAGSTARFSVTAEGAELVYQWQRSNDSGATWAGVTGATSASYTLAAATLADTGSRFRVLVSRNAQQTISSAATLTVSPLIVAPSITVQPQPVQATEGGNASFSVTATGTALAYRWQTSANGTDWADAAAGTAATWSLNAVALGSHPSQVRVVVSNSAGSVTSEAAALTVLPTPLQPAFTTQPAAASVVAPGTATFTVVATGTPAPALQWQRSSDGGSSYSNIAGATAASHTTAATSVADSGTRYRVVASNASGTVNSDAATLTVTAALVAPSFSSEPADATVALGAQASFSASASGNPAPALQWQISTDGGLTFANINGATSATLALTAATTDNGRRYRVVATNSQGSASSRAAVLTVSAPPSGLSGRAWSSGQALDQSLLITAGASAIDAQGRLTVLYSKVVVDRLVLHAVRGTAGTAGGAPVFGTAVALETGIVGDPAVVAPLAVSPSGNVLAAWVHREACGATTCSNLYTARYLVATGQWEARSLVASAESTSLSGAPQSVAINDSGDALVLSTPTVFWRAAGAASYGSQTWSTLPANINDPAFVPTAATLDQAGRTLVAGQRLPGLTTNWDIAVHRGDVRAGLGAVETIDQRGNSATFRALFSNPAGASVLMWSQDNGVRATVYAATLDSAAGSWTVTDTGQAPPVAGSTIPAALADDGNFIWYFFGQCSAQRRSAGVWQNPGPLPATLCQSTGVPGTPTLARNGKLLTLHPSNGSWLAYDPQLDQVFNPLPHAASGPGYLLGFAHPMSVLPGTLLLADNGVGAYVSVNTFSALPTAAAPNGDTGPSRLWSWFFR